MKKEYVEHRKDMVKNQISRRGISDEKVIEAMLRVPRHIFVSEIEKDRSYYDGPLPIGFGQTISQPYIVAYMTEFLELSGDESVLELGTGSGYQTAVLAEIVKSVYTVEIVKELSDYARRLLTEKLNYTNIKFKIDNGRNGWSEFAPFDRIMITAAAEKFPKKLFEQLKTPGLAIAPIGSYFQRLIKYRKSESKIFENPLIGVSFVPFV